MHLKTSVLVLLAQLFLLLHTGWDRLFATPAYLHGSPYLTAEATDYLVSQGMNIRASSPDEFSKFVANEISRWSKVVRDNKIQAGE